jgi:mycothiol synthase
MSALQTPPLGIAAETDRVRILPSADLAAELPGMFAVAARSREVDGEIESMNRDAFLAYYRSLDHFEPERDLVVARLGDAIVGYGRVEWADSNDGARWYEGACFVDPSVRRRGVGRRLLAWSERRRVEMANQDAAAGIARDRPRWLTTYNHDGDVGGDVLLRDAGYEVFRRFHSMVRPDLENIPDLPLPDGIEVRSIAGEAAIRAVIAADNEAFRDHFGSLDTDESVYTQMMGDPDTDPSLWVVAFDRDEIAGAVLNGIHAAHDGERVGWCDSIFTRRPWRRRGLARALISRSLERLRDRGVTSAALGVDAANPNEALALYESCGFRVATSATAYRKALPISLAT